MRHITQHLHCHPHNEYVGSTSLHSLTRLFFTGWSVCSSTCCGSLWSFTWHGTPPYIYSFAIFIEQSDRIFIDVSSVIARSFHMLMDIHSRVQNFKTLRSCSRPTRQTLRIALRRVQCDVTKFNSTYGSISGRHVVGHGLGTLIDSNILTNWSR